MPDAAAPPVDLGRLGQRLRHERVGRGLSLDDLASRSGVSRGMISAVERAEKAPTILVLSRIAAGLGTSIGRLLGEERAASVIVRRAGAQDVARDPSGWERRTLSPTVAGVDFTLQRMTIEPGAAGITAPGAPGWRADLAVERGTLLLTLDGTPYTLNAGDSISYPADDPHAFANPGREPVVYYLAMHAAPRVPSSAFSVRS